MPIRTFRPADDNYKKMCDSFNDMVDSNEAAKGTNAIDFMLLKVCLLYTSLRVVSC